MFYISKENQKLWDELWKKHLGEAKFIKLLDDNPKYKKHGLKKCKK